ncbi:MAG: SH3 domain-containing protein [Oscillatoriales cyanobacterium SM2_1_8]|nr:SH3 domain-containing protein [Oscillatoriales cyanobacterium SM2_1_8]
MASIVVANLAEIARASSTLAFSLGMVAALSAAVWHYIVVPYRALPPKPIYDNEKPAQNAQPKPVATTPPPAPPQPEKAVKADVLYEATVNTDIGLVLRAEPLPGSEGVGGAERNAVVEVLEETADGEWAKIRPSGDAVAGWVRAGNLSRR